MIGVEDEKVDQAIKLIGEVFDPTAIQKSHNVTLFVLKVDEFLQVWLLPSNSFSSPPINIDILHSWNSISIYHDLFDTSFAHPRIVLQGTAS